MAGADHPADDAMDLLDLVAAGRDARYAREFARAVEVGEEAVSRIRRNWINRTKRPKSQSSITQTISLENIPDEATPVLIHAFETFGSARKALHWLRTPSRVLGGRIPLDVLVNGNRAEVDDELGRIDHGVYV